MKKNLLGSPVLRELPRVFKYLILVYAINFSIWFLFRVLIYAFSGSPLIYFSNHENKFQTLFEKIDILILSPLIENLFLVAFIQIILLTEWKVASKFRFVVVISFAIAWILHGANFKSIYPAVFFIFNSSYVFRSIEFRKYSISMALFFSSLMHMFFNAIGLYSMSLF